MIVETRRDAEAISGNLANLEPVDVETAGLEENVLPSHEKHRLGEICGLGVWNRPSIVYL